MYTIGESGGEGEMAKLRKFDFNEFTKGNRAQNLKIEIGAAKLAIAENIMAAREKMGITQKQLAEQLGVKQQLISKIESGQNNTTLETLFKICHALKIVMQVHLAKTHRKNSVLEFV